MNIMITGHRPPKLGGYDATDMHTRTRDAIQRAILMAITAEDGTAIYTGDASDHTFITGMAQGSDWLGAEAALSLGMPVHAYIPCPQQPDPWPKKAQDQWGVLLNRCARVTEVSPEYTRTCLQDRNIAMVTASDHMIAVWNGTGGGTRNAIQFAMDLWYPVPSDAPCGKYRAHDLLSRPDLFPKITHIDPDDYLNVIDVAEDPDTGIRDGDPDVRL
jgi:hypothetical protein